MEIKIKGTDIEITTDDGTRYGMTWQEMRELEKAFNIIRDITKTTKIQNIELTV